MNYWLTTDTHFGHFKLVEQGLRPEGFENKIFRSFKTNIKPDDTLIHFGDVCFHEDHEWHEKLNEIVCRKWLIAGNHDKRCVSKKTRILTKQGYKSWDEIKEGDIIPTANLKTGKVEFNPVLDVYIYKNEPFIYSAKHNSGEMEVTAHHIIIYQSGLEKRTNTWKKNIAENLWETKNEIVIPCQFSSSGEYPCDHNLLKLLAWIMTDGNISMEAITIYQSKVNYIEELRSLFHILKLPYKEKVRHRDIKYICGKAVKSTLPQHEFSISVQDSRFILSKLSLKDKYHIPEWLYDLSDADFEIFLKELIKGDGTFRINGHRVLWGKKD